MDIEKRKVSFDLLKVLACISVIIIHMCAYVLNNQGVDTINYKLANSYAAVAHWAVGVFVMITGMFLLNKKEEIPLKRLLTHYALRMGLIYLITALLYKISYFYINGGHDLTISTLFGMFIRSLTGSSHLHLWYLYMLVPLYLLYPLLYKLVKNSTRKELKYTLVVIFILSSLLFSINELLGLLRVDFRVSLELKLSIYIFYFLAGYYLYKYKLSKIKSIILLSLIPVSSILTIFLSITRAMQIKGFSLNFINYESANIVLLTLGVFYLFVLIDKRIKFNETSSDIICTLSKETLGIYLIHMLVMDIIYKFNYVNFNLFKNVLMIPIYSIFIFLICFVITYTVKLVCKVIKKLK